MAEKSCIKKYPQDALSKKKKVNQAMQWFDFTIYQDDKIISLLTIPKFNFF